MGNGGSFPIPEGMSQEGLIRFLSDQEKQAEMGIVTMDDLLQVLEDRDRLREAGLLDEEAKESGNDS